MCQHVEEWDERGSGVVFKQNLPCLRSRCVVEHVVEVKEDERSRWCWWFDNVFVDCCRCCVGDEIDSAFNLYSVLSPCDQQRADGLGDVDESDFGCESSQCRANPNGSQPFQVLGVLVKGQKVVASEDGVHGGGKLRRDQELEKLLHVVKVWPC